MGISQRKDFKDRSSFAEVVIKKQNRRGVYLRDGVDDGYSLDDVPQVSGSVKPQQSVADGHLVEVGSLLVA